MRRVIWNRVGEVNRELNLAGEIISTKVRILIESPKPDEWKTGPEWAVTENDIIHAELSAARKGDRLTPVGELKA